MTPQHKKGFILSKGSQTPYTVTDPLERPHCPQCNERLSEGMSVLNKGLIKHLSELGFSIPASEGDYAGFAEGDDIYSWWCDERECKRDHNRLFGVNAKSLKLRTLNTDINAELPKYGIGKTHFSCRLDNFEGYDAFKDRAKIFIKKPKGNLFFTGGCGSGKTHIAVAILRELVSRGNKDMYLKNVSELMYELRGSFEDDSVMKENDIIERYVSIGFLILDDLGAEKQTAYSAGSLYTIIEQRLRNEKASIITTNLSIDEIGKKIDMRVASRLAECDVWRFSMPDYRRIR